MALINSNPIVLGILLSLSVIIIYNQAKNTKRLSTVTKAEVLILTTALNANSCLHLELPASDNHDPKRTKGNSKTNTGRNKANKGKVRSASKTKP